MLSLDSLNHLGVFLCLIAKLDEVVRLLQQENATKQAEWKQVRRVLLRAFVIDLWRRFMSHSQNIQHPVVRLNKPSGSRFVGGVARIRYGEDSRVIAKRTIDTC